MNTMKYWIYYEPEQGTKAIVTQSRNIVNTAFVDKLKQLDILCNSGHKHMAMAESSRPGITPDFSLHKQQ